MIENISTELRWILLAVGALLILGLALAGRRRKQAVSDSIAARATHLRANESVRTSSYSNFRDDERDDEYDAPIAKRRTVQEPLVHNLGDIEVVEYDSEEQLFARHKNVDRTIPMANSDVSARESMNVQMDSSMQSSIDDLPSISAFDDEPHHEVPVVEAVIESIELSSNRADAASAGVSDVMSDDSDHDPHFDAGSDSEHINITRRESQAETVDLDVEQARIEKAHLEQTKSEASRPEQPKPQSLTRRPVSRKIVALRLVLPESQVEGSRLREQFTGEQLSFGKYSIFHRLDDHGIEVFSVASMVEPGVFDLQKMDALSYSGLTFFMQVPGPHEATAAYDQMLDCARNLEEALQATLQDERGIPLSPLRAERIREEIIDFEHLNRISSVSTSGSTHLSR
jgi:FtsZ-interacting cell division protein ZipA